MFKLSTAKEGFPLRLPDLNPVHSCVRHGQNVTHRGFLRDCGFSVLIPIPPSKLSVYKTETKDVGIRSANHTTPPNNKSWIKRSLEAATARSVESALGKRHIDWVVQNRI
jgi:hypothetical protein